MINTISVFGKKISIPEQPDLSQEEALGILLEVDNESYKELMNSSYRFEINGNVASFVRTGATFG